MAKAQTPTKDKEMATREVAPAGLDLSKMSVEEMLALSEKLKKAAEEQSQKLFDDTMNFLNDKLKAMGRTKFDAMMALYELMDAVEKKSFVDRFRAAAGSA
jgi:hypothetical protein